jgi:protoheme IX farnesyltransferase
MSDSHITTINVELGIFGRLSAFIELLKLRLSFLVVFSSAFGYMLGSRGSFEWMSLLMFCLGGFLISGSAVTLNQVSEIEYDRKMKRTKTRPLPTERVFDKEAMIYAVILAITGTLILFYFTNTLTTVLSLISFVLYVFVYTPLKRVGPIAVLVGAIPGALPPLLGWTAASGMISHEALIIFGIQFIWQFPHFWAIAWIADEDYKKAGFKLLPGNGEKNINTAFQIMIYTLFLIPMGLLPTVFGLTGVISGAIATLCGVLFLSQTFRHMKNCNRNTALTIMYSSFLYLPIVQIAYLIDKI